MYNAILRSVKKCVFPKNSYNGHFITMDKKLYSYTNTSTRNFKPLNPTDNFVLFFKVVRHIIDLW